METGSSIYNRPDLPGIEPVIIGLQVDCFIHYTTVAPKSFIVHDFNCKGDILKFTQNKGPDVYARTN